MTTIDRARNLFNDRLGRQRRARTPLAGYMRQRAVATSRHDWKPLLDSVLAPVSGELTRVDQLIAAQMVPANPAVRDAAGHICNASGKALRPATVLWSARLGGGVTPTVVKAAAIVELMHVATLHHDDVIDDAATRRGVASVNAHWGNTIAILSGDFLLAAATRLAAEVDEEVAENRSGGRSGLGKGVATTLLALVDGQVAELDRLYDLRRSEDEYLASIRGKTAALFRLASHVGAVVGGADERTCRAAGAFGESFGMGFQIADDLLDIRATSAEIGKPACNDIRQGVYTLPVLAALRRSPSLAAELTADRPDYAVIRQIVIDSGGYDDAVQVAGRWFDKAAAALDAFRCEAADALLDMTQSVFARISGDAASHGVPEELGIIDITRPQLAHR